LAAQFAEPYADPDLTRFVALAHDIGKFSDAFQEYLLASEAGEPVARTDHKAVGASLVAETLGPLGMLVQGHHGGLRSPQEFRSWLGERSEADDGTQVLQRAMASLPELQAGTSPSLPSWVRCNPWEAEMFMRMLFSALVDADYLDTEAHFNPAQTKRRANAVGLDKLWHRFEEHRRGLPVSAAGSVGWVRQEAYKACLEAAATYRRRKDPVRDGICLAARHLASAQASDRRGAPDKRD